MATIQERAKQAGLEIAGWNDTLRQGFEAGYEIGAKEQHKIDIDKACEWLKDYAYFSVSETTGALDDNDLIDRFKKAMEE